MTGRVLEVFRAIGTTEQPNMNNHSREENSDCNIFENNNPSAENCTNEERYMYP